LIQHRIIELCCLKSHFWNIGPGALTPDTWHLVEDRISKSFTGKLHEYHSFMGIGLRAFAAAYKLFGDFHIRLAADVERHSLMKVFRFHV